jgi:hypothetical protein
MKAVESDFKVACERLKSAEGDLIRALESLSAARDERDPDSVTKAYTRAKAAERACSEEWERVERIRQAYWRNRARQAQARLESTVMPLLSEIVTQTRYAGALAPVIPHEILRTLACAPLPPMADVDTVIPTEQLYSAALERADDEIL